MYMWGIILCIFKMEDVKEDIIIIVNIVELFSNCELNHPLLKNSSTSTDLLTMLYDVKYINI